MAVASVHFSTSLVWVLPSVFTSVKCDVLISTRFGEALGKMADSGM
jgi:hypothetical protein